MSFLCILRSSNLTIIQNVYWGFEIFLIISFKNSIYTHTDQIGVCKLGTSFSRAKKLFKIELLSLSQLVSNVTLFLPLTIIDSVTIVSWDLLGRIDFRWKVISFGASTLGGRERWARSFLSIVRRWTSSQLISHVVH